MFPMSVLGRANSALNLVHVTAAFAIQYASASSCSNGR
jgi:hypothetical protein